jgi:HPt (histidine-containing phosphotransfer) domain-containing protein
MVQLNRDVIAQLREAVGDGAFAEIAGDFVKDSTRLEGALRHALASGDPQAARAYAHELRGLAATFGADVLVQTCKTVETAGGAALREVDKAAKAAASARDELKRFLRERRSGAA